jgi:hypothetical protein
LSRTSGCFTILGLGADSTGAIGADPLGLHVLYTATAGNVTVVSNRAALAARLITGPGRGPARDAEGAVWVAYAGSIIDDRTSFRDVRVLPVGSTISFGRNGPPEVLPGRSTPWLDTSAAVDPLDPASYAPAVEDLRSNLRLVLSIPAWKHDLELTGGKDSRMILGMLLADFDGREQECQTHLRRAAELEPANELFVAAATP